MRPVVTKDRIEFNRIHPGGVCVLAAVLIVLGIVLADLGVWVVAWVYWSLALVSVTSKSKLTFLLMDKKVQIARSVLLLGERSELWASEISHIAVDMVSGDGRNSSVSYFQAKVVFADKTKKPFLIANSPNMHSVLAEVKSLVDAFPVHVKFSEKLNELKNSLQSLDALPSGSSD